MPQHAKRVRISRKALREPDEFQTLTTRAGIWIQAHQALALGVTGVLVAVLAVVVGVGWYRNARAATAAARFQEGRTLFETGKAGEAAVVFAEVTDHYGNTPFGRIAGLYRAYALAKQDDAAGAATAYGEYLASGPPADYLRQAALNGLGHAKEASGDTAGAIQAYTEAGGLAGPYQTDALLAAARLHEAAGALEQSRALYAEVLKLDPSPEVKTLVQAKLPQTPPSPAAEPKAAAEP
jgi:tetratricopeptide (TPR) repeat protein